MNVHEELTKTCLSYWFPLLEGSGLPVPKTRLVQMTPSATDIICNLISGATTEPLENERFIADLKKAAEEISLPCFLRTGHTSNKHRWNKTCFVEHLDAIPAHVMELVEFSECADLVGLPWGVWAVREMLPTIPHGTCPRYGHMPVNKEFRFFVDDGAVRCWHPYWPEEALEEGGWTQQSPEEYASLCALDSFNTIADLAGRAGRAVPGSWSIDILETSRGWYVTDMAPARRSFHWEGCDKA